MINERREPLFDSDHHLRGFSHACVASLRPSLPSHRLRSHIRDAREVDTRRHGPPPAAGTTRSSRPRRRDLRPLCDSEAPAPLPPAAASGKKTLNLNGGGPPQEVSRCIGEHASSGPQRRETTGEPSLSKGLGSTWHTGCTPPAAVTRPRRGVMLRDAPGREVYSAVSGDRLTRHASASWLIRTPCIT